VAAERNIKTVDSLMLQNIGVKRRVVKCMEKISYSNFATYHNHRAEPYFTFLKEGQKTIEGRINKGWYRTVKPGDHIIVYNEKETDSVKTVVTNVRKYTSIREMLEVENIKRLLPDIQTIEEGLKVYYRFYTEDQEKEFGMIAIEVKLISRRVVYGH
jgi:ASC-1-like (ASCH) protein